MHFFKDLVGGGVYSELESNGPKIGRKFETLSARPEIFQLHVSLNLL